MTSTPSTPHWLFYVQVSILVEIQIHDSEVRKASAAQQRFYQIFRAISSEKLHKVEAHHTTSWPSPVSASANKAIRSLRSLPGSMGSDSPTWMSQILITPTISNCDRLLAEGVYEPGGMPQLLGAHM